MSTGADALLHEANRIKLLEASRRIGRLSRIRPTFLASPLLSLFSERKIIEVEGMRLFIDPTTHLGRSILSTGSYEPETIRQFRANLKRGLTVLDIGANEGFFSALAAQIIGPKGKIIAVEPQSRLQDVLEINLALNASGNSTIIPHIVAEQNDVGVEINLYPISNTGASSVVAGYRFGNRKELRTTITPETILERCHLERVDFVKIDVEGFEPEIARALVPLLERGAIEAILLDYHSHILAARGIDAAETDTLITRLGMQATEGSIGSGYVLYRRS